MRTVLHVLPDGQNWVLTRNSDIQPMKQFFSRDDAILKAKTTAFEEDSYLLLHREDCSIEMVVYTGIDEIDHLHVVPHEMGWAVFEEMCSKPLRTFSSKVEAINFSEMVAMNSEVTLVVHGLDGEIEYEYALFLHTAEPQGINYL